MYLSTHLSTVAILKYLVFKGLEYLYLSTFCRYLAGISTISTSEVPNNKQGQ